MRTKPYLITKGQTVQLHFVITFEEIPKKDIIVKLQLNYNIQLEPISFKLTEGKYHELINREYFYRFVIPETISVRNIDSLGTFEILEGTDQLIHGELSGVDIIDKTRYFEHISVPDILENMGFICENIGEGDNPDILVNHQDVNPDDKWNVECTLTKNYDSDKWYQDTGKFRKYSRDRKLSRLLIICNSENITTKVIEELNASQEPIGLIDFNDLKSLNESFRINNDFNAIYTTLTRNGLIRLGSPASKAEISEIKPFRIKRHIGIKFTI